MGLPWWEGVPPLSLSDTDRSVQVPLGPSAAGAEEEAMLRVWTLARGPGEATDKFSPGM